VMPVAVASGNMRVRVVHQGPHLPQQRQDFRDRVLPLGSGGSDPSGTRRALSLLLRKSAYASEFRIGRLLVRRLVGAPGG
jgi:hypothetical protein